jgi:hypothetical protein
VRAADFPKFDRARHPLLGNATLVKLLLSPGEAQFIPFSLDFPR